METWEEEREDGILIPPDQLAPETLRGVLEEFVGDSPSLFEGGSAKPGIVPHAETGSLLISASQKDFAALKQLIDQLDT